MADTGKSGYPAMASAASINERFANNPHTAGLNLLYMDGHVIKKNLASIKTTELLP